jgi:hypothetical protein
MLRKVNKRLQFGKNQVNMSNKHNNTHNYFCKYFFPDGTLSV